MDSSPSEIEVVPLDSNTHQPPTESPPPAIIIADVFSASAYGDLNHLKRFVEHDNASVSLPDANGYYPLQWAALNNSLHVAQYIIDHGGDVNAGDNVEQTALHWAAVKGSVDVADLLLQRGARIEAADINGYRAVHVASQYGQTAFLNHLVVEYSADYNALDNGGRSPLHWAAYNGFNETVRLLLFRDACQNRQDNTGCTPLHWAVIKENVEACTLLVYAGTKEELILEDNTGSTPLKLASDKGHRQLTLFLLEIIRLRRLFTKCSLERRKEDIVKYHFGRNHVPLSVVGPPYIFVFTSKAMQTRSNGFANKIFCGKLGEASYAPMLFCLIVAEMVLFFTSIVAAPNLPKITAMVALWAWFGLSCGVCSLIAFRRCSSKDPGYVKRSNEADSDHTANDPLIDINFNSPSWKGNWSQLCPTCKVIRPVRSKHCPTCKRCVEQFDHHCPWISNCVGKKNKRDFLVFVIMGALTSFVGGSTAVQRLWRSIPHDSLVQHVVIEHPGAAVFLFFDFLIFIATMTLTISQAYMIARNITTNELWNTKRFSYLRGSDGRFYNPYNHGWRRNCSDFLVHGYTRDDEVVPSSIL